VIIKANSITGNGYSVLAKGNDNTAVANCDGAGGGGAGGTVILDAGSFTQTTVLVSGDLAVKQTVPIALDRVAEAAGVSSGFLLP